MLNQVETTKIKSLMVAPYDIIKQKDRFILSATYESGFSQAILITDNLENVKARCKILQAAFPQITIFSLTNDIDLGDLEKYPT